MIQLHDAEKETDGDDQRSQAEPRCVRSDTQGTPMQTRVRERQIGGHLHTIGQCGPKSRRQGDELQQRDRDDGATKQEWQAESFELCPIHSPKSEEEERHAEKLKDRVGEVAGLCSTAENQTCDHHSSTSAKQRRWWAWVCRKLETQGLIGARSIRGMTTIEDSAAAVPKTTSLVSRAGLAEAHGDLS